MKRLVVQRTVFGGVTIFSSCVVLATVAFGVGLAAYRVADFRTPLNPIYPAILCFGGTIVGGWKWLPEFESSDNKEVI